jgi:FrmR/RcnR family transcriptional regulator, repressor of frmRAB operon
VVNSKLLGRMQRIRGHVEAVERAIEQEMSCSDLLPLIARAHGELNGLVVDVVENHIRTHVVDPVREPNSQRSSATADLIDIIRSYSK